MNGSDGKNKDESNGLKTKWLVITLCSIALTILGFYFGNFHGSLSSDNSVWGTFGDYVGGILNPVIAAFAFYLITKTYELQKKELVATRKLLKESTELAALTALLNLNLTRISILESTKSLIDQRRPSEPYPGVFESSPGSDRIKNAHDSANKRIQGLNKEIESHVSRSEKIEKLIEEFLKKNAE